METEYSGRASSNFAGVLVEIHLSPVDRPLDEVSQGRRKYKLSLAGAKDSGRYSSVLAPGDLQAFRRSFKRLSLDNDTA